MKKLVLSITVIVSLFITNCKSQNKENNKAIAVQGTVIHLTDASFKTKVFNYTATKEWKYLGDKPCIIDFYADWCGPCRMLSPRLEEIAKEYAGKLVVYKVNTDQEQLLSTQLGISSLPTVLFCPVKGMPQASMGLVPKETLVKAINDVLLIK